MAEAEVNATPTMLRQTEDQLAVLADNMDAMFLLFNAIIVSLMQAGFACLEAGCVHSKNVTSIILKNILDMFLCAICYWLVGYSLSYSPGNAFLGYSQWAGVGVAESSMAHWFFQFVFAATAATILSGAVAERCNFFAYIIYSCIIGGFIYPVVAHWAWGEGGMLAEFGYKDFAGSGIVHAMAGVCSFVAAALIGPRIGRFQDGALVDKPGHSTPLTGLGGLLLASGFLAFNGGSLGHISRPGDGEIVARSVTNTILGGSGAGMLILILNRTGLIGKPCWAFAVTLNAVLAGMVSVCAGVDSYTSLAALICGAVACLVYLLLRFAVLYVQVDDPLEAVAVHLGGGLWGVIAMPLFANGGIVYGVNDQSLMLLWHNLLGAIAIVIWSAVCSLILFGVLRLLGLLRVSEEEELKGLDISKHNEPGYPPKAWDQNYEKDPHIHKNQTYHKNGSYTLEVLGGQTMAFDNMTMELDNRQRLR